MSIKFEVKMTTKSMYDFMLYHNYTHLSGLGGAILGVIGLWIGISNATKGNAQAAIVGFAVAALFLIMTPWSTRQTAKRQVTTTEMFQKPLEYELHEEGITVRQDEAEVTNKWEDVVKVVSTNQSILVYVTRMRALILPKECLGAQYGNVVKMISTHVAPKKVNIRHLS